MDKIYIIASCHKCKTENKILHTTHEFEYIADSAKYVLDILHYFRSTGCSIKVYNCPICNKETLHDVISVDYYGEIIPLKIPDD